MRSVFLCILFFAFSVWAFPVQIRNDTVNVAVINSDSSLKVSGTLAVKDSAKIYGIVSTRSNIVSDTNTRNNKVFIVDSGNDTAQVDEYNGIVMIELPHHEIHVGDYFYSLIDTTLATAASDTLKVLLWDSLKTGDPIHVVFEVYSNNGAGTMDIYESDSNFSGTVNTVLNRKRTSSNTTQWTVRKNIALKGGGVLIYHNEFGTATGSGSNKLGGAKRDESEIILNPLKRYKIICRVAGNGTNLNVEIHFYE